MIDNFLKKSSNYNIGILLIKSCLEWVLHCQAKFIRLKSVFLVTDNYINFMQTLVKVLPRAIEKIKNVKNSGQNQHKFLRVGISGGGCNGFQYLFNLDDKLNQDDLILYQEGKEIMVVTDKISEEFLKNGEIDFVEDLGGSEFKINNPNASSSCGCGASFSI